MVAPSVGSTIDGPPDSRAQLILVGSIAIAVVLIGITLVINSAVFTENVAGGSSVEVTGDVSEFDREAVRNVRSLTIRVNHETAYMAPPGGGVAGGANGDLEEDVRGNVSEYSRILTESYADTGSVYVNTTVESVDEFGVRIIQREDDEFTEESPPRSTWSPIDERVKLGWFTMNLDVGNVSQSAPFYVGIRNTSGSEMNVSIRRTDSNRVAVNSSIAGSHVSNVTCSPENGRVLLDVVDGSAYNGGCSFNSTEHLDPPYNEIRFVHGDRAEGKYELVVNETSPAGTPPVDPHCGAGAPHDRPCRALAVWSLNFTTRYQTGSVEYENTHNVTVYDP